MFFFIVGMSGKVKKSKHSDEQVHKEFGGALGAFGIILFSHIVIYYFWICIRFYGGALQYPAHLSDFEGFWSRMRHGLETVYPTWTAFYIYGGFVLFEVLLAVCVPGLPVKGLPVPSAQNKQLTYLCNGIGSWYITLLTVAVLHVSGVFPLYRVWDNWGALISVAVLVADLLAVLVYVGGIITRNSHRMSGNVLYDFFMGSWLNPRCGNFDLKIFAEIRVAWIMLFLLTLSCAAQQYKEYGYVSFNSMFMVLAHALYANACMKGEECIPTTWDIFYEKLGWMLIFWNFAGVPFVYSLQSVYLANQAPFSHSPLVNVGLLVLLLGAYYIWDTANSQKNRFRMQLAGTYVERNTFPQLPWGTVKNPTSIKTPHGVLLTGGWWGYARKIHYTADILMALSWGLVCGFRSSIPYFYIVFFLAMIYHRVSRDMQRCAAKYGAYWTEYCKKVPYLFVPGII